MKPTNENKKMGALFSSKSRVKIIELVDNLCLCFNNETMQGTLNITDEFVSFKLSEHHTLTTIQLQALHSVEHVVDVRVSSDANRLIITAYLVLPTANPGRDEEATKRQIDPAPDFKKNYSDSNMLTLATLYRCLDCDRDQVGPPIMFIHKRRRLAADEGSSSETPKRTHHEDILCAHLRQDASVSYNEWMCLTSAMPKASIKAQSLHGRVLIMAITGAALGE